MKAMSIFMSHELYMFVFQSESLLIHPYVSFIPSIGIIPEKESPSALCKDYRNKTKFLNRNDQNFLFPVIHLVVR